MTYSSDESIDASPGPSDAVLLLNLGTPQAPTAAAVRRYLAEFLSDTRVIDYPRWLWWPLLHGVILRVRPRVSARAYASIWTPQGSPLLTYTRNVAERLHESFAGQGLRVTFAMRYGEPSIAATIDKLLAGGVRRVLVVPLYPQYSATSSGSALDGVFMALQKQRWLPKLRCIDDYHDQPEYIEALAGSIEAYWLDHGRGERLILSFHGIPQRYARAGDPYEAQCMATAKLLRERLGLDEATMLVTFQSRVGREPWLQPYTDVTLEQLGRDGVRHVQVACPGFAVDCLETLEEIAIRGREQFQAGGGGRLDYIPALNDGDGQIRLLSNLIESNTLDWNV